MRKFTLLKTMLLWLCLAVGGNVWGQSDYSSTYTSNVTLTTTGGTNASACKVVISGTEYAGIKCGTSKAAGAMKVTVPAGAKYLHIHVAGWKDETVALSVSPTSNVSLTSISLTANNGIASNSPFTFDGNASSSDYYKVITFTNALESDTEITLAATNGKRFVVWGVNSEEEDDRTPVNMTSFTAAAIELVKGNKTTTTVTNDQSGWTAAYTYTSNNEEVAKVAANGDITAVAKGTATITATLNVDAGDANYKAGSTKSKTVDITVKNPNHTATFYANGTACHTTEVEEGEAIDFPDSDPSDLAGKVFVGWVETKIDGTTDDEPSLVTSAEMGTSNVDYYAVYAIKTGNTTSVTDELTYSLTGVTGTSYSSWSDKKVTSDAVYAGNSAGGNSSIQLRSNNNNSGIISTTSGGKVKKVVVEWNDNTSSGRTLDIYGNNTAYTDASQLYETEKQGTELGKIVYGTTSTELTIDGDYEYVGLRSNSGAMYLTSISITWEAGSVTYSDYCTTVTVPAEITAAGYKTLYCDAALNFEGVDGLEAFIAEKEGTKVNFTKVNSVPANTGVLLKGNAGTYQIPVVANSSTDVSTNQFLGVLKDTELSSGIFVLMNGAEGVGFYKTTKAFTVGANTAYLPASVAEAKSFIGFDFGETTGVESFLQTPALKGEPLWFNLAGQRVAQPTKGLYIVNGKKVVVK